MKIRATCSWCGKPNLPWWVALSLEAAVCNDCRNWWSLLHSETPEHLLVGEQEEQEPEDVGICGPCQGTGEVVVLDPTGAPLREYGSNAPVIETCWHCAGTGDGFAMGKRVPDPEWLKALGREPVA